MHTVCVCVCFFHTNIFAVKVKWDRKEGNENMGDEKEWQRLDRGVVVMRLLCVLHFARVYPIKFNIMFNVPAKYVYCAKWRQGIGL